MRRYSQSSLHKGVFRRRWPVKNRKKWIGTKETVVPPATRRVFVDWSG